MEKMIFRILLLITLTCNVWLVFVIDERTFDVRVAETFYEAEENKDIPLEWTFTTEADRSLDALNIDCSKVNNHKEIVLFRLAGGVEVPESQDEQFAGRVLFDKDVLGEGRIRLNVSSLRADDAGEYLCEVKTEYGEGSDVCRLTVGAARTDPERRSSESTVWKDVVSKLGLTAGLAALLIAFCLNIYDCPHLRRQRTRREFTRTKPAEPLTETKTR